MAEKAELAFGVGVEQVTWRMVNQARSWVRQYLRRTPLLECPELSDLLGVSLLLKAENLQWTGSFKVRGGLVKLLSVLRKFGDEELCALPQAIMGKALLSSPASLAFPLG